MTSIFYFFLEHFWLSLSIVFVSGIGYLLFNELEDESVRNNFNKYTWFLNIEESADRKWYTKDGKKRHKIWSTLLVFTTDGEHLFQFIKNIFILIGILFTTFVGLYGFVAWLVGKSLMQVVKEKAIKFIH